MKRCRSAVLLFCLIIFYSVFQHGVAAQSSSQVNISSQGRIVYPPPATNLARIPYDWGDYEGNIVYGSGPQICHLDSTVTHNGNPSMALGPHVEGVDINHNREINGKWYTVQPGDRVVASCWIRTNESSTGKNGNHWYGGRIGVDLYGTASTIIDSYPHDGAEGYYSFVPFNTPNWEYRVWNFTIPSTVYTKDVLGNPITPTQVTLIVMWTQVLPLEDKGFAWFADAELYINP